jgi:hypothetical protein
MAHQRKNIRDAVRALLLGKTSAGTRVFKTRLVPFRRLTLPAIAVYARSEPVDPESKNTAPRELRRELKLVLEAMVAEGSTVAGEVVKGTDGTPNGDGSPDLDDALDQLALEIERAMDADPTLGIDAVDTSILADSQLDVITEVEGRAIDPPVGLLTLTYAVTYFTSAPDAADVVLDDLATVDTKTNVGGAQDPANQAEDKNENLDTE